MACSSTHASHYTFEYLANEHRRTCPTWPMAHACRRSPRLFDRSLSFRPHVDYVCKRANRLRGFITRTSRAMPHHAFCALFTALVLPVLEYCSTIWSPHQIDLQKRLESVQRKASKTALHIKDRATKLPYERRLQTLRWSRLDGRRLFSRRVLLYKFLHGDCPIPEG